VRRKFSLAHLTVIRLSPPEVIEVAARTGYETVGLRLTGGTEITPAYSLMDDKPLMRATKAAMTASGVGVLDIEFVRITPETDVVSLERFAAAGAELDAKYIITSAYDPDLSRFTDRLAAVSDLASRYGMRAMLEFFPWTVVPDLNAALSMVDGAERPALGILVDTLHFDRSTSTVDALARIPASRLPYVHVADAPVQAIYTTEELLHAARVERLPPGEGGIDIKRILSNMPQDIPIALEVPRAALAAAEGEEAVALRVRQAAERLLSS
jgi:sugar phosphate isomerase/epimerase